MFLKNMIHLNNQALNGKQMLNLFRYVVIVIKYLKIRSFINIHVQMKQAEKDIYTGMKNIQKKAISLLKHQLC